MKTTVLKRVTALVCAMSLCFAMASCGDSSSNKDNESKSGIDTSTTKNQEVESSDDDLNDIAAIPYDQKPLSSDFFAYQFEIDGDVISLPIKLGELKSLGYVFNKKRDIAKGTTLIHAHKEGKENDSMHLSLRCVDDTAYRIDISGPDCNSLEGHTVKISGNITLYSDDYEKILASINGIKGGRFGDQFKKEGAENSFIRLYNNGTPTTVLASVFMCNYDALSDEQKAKSNFVET